MEKRYKLTIFNKNLYKEVELSSEMTKVKIGTTVGCDIRLQKYFDDFEMVLEQQNGEWIITASDSIYFNFYNNQKKLTTPLKHGAVFHVRYEKYTVDLFVCRFLIDFDYEKKDYDMLMDISKSAEVTIGTKAGNNIVISSPYVNDDCVVLQQSSDGLTLRCKHSKYGVLHNGKPVIQEAELRDYDFFSIADFSFYYKKGILYTSKSKNIRTNGVNASVIGTDENALIYPKFNRSGRLKVKLDEEEIKLLAPKEKPKRPKSNLLLKLLPALSMIVLTVAIRGFMSNSSNMSFILFSVCSMSVGAIVSIFTIINDKKEYKQEIADREKDYTAYIVQKRSEIEIARKEEEEILSQIYYPYSVTSAFVKNFSGNLYDREPDDDDYLDIRIGIGSIKATRKIEYKPQETYESADDELVDLPVNLSEEYQNLSEAPIVVHLKAANVVGVVGKREFQYEMLKIMFFDICVRQYFHDVELFLFVKKEEIQKYQWTKWYKHLKNNVTGCRNIVCDDESKTNVFEYLYAEFSKRENSKSKEFLPHIIVFVASDYGIQQHPVSKYIKSASELGGTFIFFEDNKEYVPIGCSQLIMLESESSGRLIQTQNRTEVSRFSYMQIPDTEMNALSHKLAPVYCEEISLEGSLTKNITLYQLLNIVSEEDLDLQNRWSRSDVTKSMAAPLGVRAGNEIVYLDILDGDGHHGPHGLVAGTTGSGKSEVLMTYILSMATLFSPYEVAFLIIDFKGGGMGNQFKDLPHTLGVITDIDGKEISRSLTSIKAELDRRKRLFADADVDHINKYIKAWKSKKIKTPLPHLIIIVDEFAELKAQFPDFMEELKSAARIGRTLGVHLILATQKPQGQVDPQIDSNSKFRLCLKVQTPEDSREVIKTPLAAEIREAGRAYFMVGNNEVFDLFQSAYSGAPSGLDISSNQKEFMICAVDFAGRRKIIFERKHKKPAEGETVVTQKDAVAKWIEGYFNSNHFVKLPGICQPPLEKEIKYVLHSRSNDVGIYADLGIFDDPAHQRQELYSVNVAAQHMLIIGALQTGKTNVLQLLIRNLSEKYTPDEVNFYIIDYSSMILSNFNELAHVGGVVVPNEDEKLNNLFKLLTNEISARKQKLKSIGVSSFMAYKEAGKTDLPLIMLLIDNFTALKEQSLGESTVLMSILREGLSVGISIVVSNGSTKGIDHRYFASLSCRIGLHHNNSDEYGTLFGVFKLSVDPIPGRCIVVVDKNNLECQLYQSFEGLKEIERVNSIKDFIQRINTYYPNRKAPLIPEIPEFLMEGDIRKQYAMYYSKYQIILGFDYDTLMPKKINLSGLCLLISGTPESGKGNFVRYIISCLEISRNTAPTEAIVFDKAAVKKFETTSKAYSCVSGYEMSPENMTDICKRCKTELESRKQLVLANHGDMSVLDEKPLLLMIFEDSSKDMLEKFDETLFSYLPYKFAWIASNVENDDMAPMAAPKLYKAKNAGAGFMFFGNILASKSIDKFARIKPADKSGRLGMDMEPGDAFYVDAKDSTKIYRMKTIIHQENAM